MPNYHKIIYSYNLDDFIGKCESNISIIYTFSIISDFLLGKGDKKIVNKHWFKFFIIILNLSRMLFFLLVYYKSTYLHLAFFYLTFKPFLIYLLQHSFHIVYIKCHNLFSKSDNLILLARFSIKTPLEKLNIMKVLSFMVIIFG